MGSLRLVRRLRLSLALLLLAAVTPHPIMAQSGPEPRVPAGKANARTRALLAREAPGEAWHAPSEVFTRDLLLALPGVSADIALANQGVKLSLRGGLPEFSDLPALESAIVLHDSRAFDLDFTLDRGRVVVTNAKKEGAALVWARLAGVSWELRLTEPGTEVALERVGRWGAGVPFQREGQRDRPTQIVALFVLRGSATLRVGKMEHGLRAPPGPAYLSWDGSIEIPEPQRMEKLPEWADPKAADKLPASLRSQLGPLAQLEGESIEAGLATYFRQAQRLSDGQAANARRRLAVLSMAAIDDLQGVLDTLSASEHSEPRTAAVDALRHWIGRDASQDLRLFRFLVLRQEYTEPQAETVLHLLHSPFVASQPETYETLIAYLRHSKPTVRELAHWHLKRLAPAGRDIAYDAAAAEAERQKSYEAWKKLIPPGKLPPDPKKP